MRALYADKHVRKEKEREREKEQPPWLWKSPIRWAGPS